MLPKRPSDQSKTSSNYGRAAYSTHSSLANNSSTTSFFEICRSIFTARGSTTKLMFDQSSLFFESCQVLCDQNSTFLLILRLPNARLQILIFSLSTILSRRAGYHILPPLIEFILEFLLRKCSASGHTPPWYVVMVISSWTTPSCGLGHKMCFTVSSPFSRFLWVSLEILDSLHLDASPIILLDRPFFFCSRILMAHP